MHPSAPRARRVLSKKEILVDIRHVVFDLDGTLIDSFSSGYEACCAVAGRLGWPTPDRETLRRLWGVDAGDLLRAVYPGRDPESFRYVWRYVEEDGVFPARAFPGVCASIRELRAADLMLCILTNRGGEDHALRKLPEADIDPKDFLFLHTRVEGAPAKPDRRALEAVLKRLTVPADRTRTVCVVSDRAEDGEMALACGCRFVGVLSGAHAEADFIPLLAYGAGIVQSVASLPQFFAILERT